MSSLIIVVCPTAHPRVGGENEVRADESFLRQGSSPRGRGKRCLVIPPGPVDGLIPAWAGKTGAVQVETGQPRAHPRVGGENVARPAGAGSPLGSSPRGRGKPTMGRLAQSAQRLIPAWAGKTSAWSAPAGDPGAHPRVGGENLIVRVPDAAAVGSSPRGRGKLASSMQSRSWRGLIPAWAGKTVTIIERRTCSGAHPRVGGENTF